MFYKESQTVNNVWESNGGETAGVVHRCSTRVRPQGGSVLAVKPTDDRFDFVHGTRFFSLVRLPSLCLSYVLVMVVSSSLFSDVQNIVGHFKSKAETWTGA